MSDTELHEAADAVDRATDGVEDTERAQGLADQLRSLADGERRPDHGRLARVENALGELSEGASADADAAIDDAKAAIEAYREDLPGV